MAQQTCWGWAIIRRTDVGLRAFRADPLSLENRIGAQGPVEEHHDGDCLRADVLGARRVQSVPLRVSIQPSPSSAGLSGQGVGYKAPVGLLCVWLAWLEVHGGTEFEPVHQQPTNRAIHLL